MTYQTMSYLTIVFKVGITLIGILVLSIALTISRRRNRIAQKKIDDAIVNRSPKDVDGI
jgi:hypothetical protein